ncbi:MAG TPA: TIGR03618 family F420-dependent PPOX class oxidoreductase [Candidatus Dormibacteraeota bacterium]
MPRADIRMTPEEVLDFLAGRYDAALATLGPDGYPHQASMWYVLDGDRVLMWTFRKSQKARNLTRDRRASLLVDAGEGYGELRGVLIRGEVEVVEDVAEVTRIGLALADRYGGRYGADAATTRTAHERQAPKRIGIVLDVRRVASWDFGRIGG